MSTSVSAHGNTSGSLTTGSWQDLVPGTVTLVGGGPGDPGLMTVAGRSAIEQADVVLVDNLAPSDALAWARDDAEIVHVAKLPRAAFTPQETINDLLVTHAQAGLRVVRLKGGDGFVFGRGMEEVEACTEAGVPVRVVPGVSASVAVPALAGIPVTHRGLVQGFTVVSGHLPPGHADISIDWAALARSGTTIVVLMGVKNLPAITETLQAHGLAATTPAAVIANGGLPEQRVVRADLAAIAEAARDIAPPAITVIGAVAGYAQNPTTPNAQTPTNAQGAN